MGIKRYSIQTENEKQVGIAIHISDKIDFQTKTGERDKQKSLHND